MPLSEFIREVTRITELCNYPNDQDRLIRDTMVSGVYSLRAYQKCIDAKDLSLQECINICQAEDAIRMQVQECRLQRAQTMIPVHRLHHGFKQSSNSNRYKNKSSWNCYYCGAPNWTSKHSRVCKAKNSIRGKCGKKRAPQFTMQKHRDTPTHERGTRLQPSTISRDCTRLQSECRDCTVFHTILHFQTGAAISEVQQPQDCTSLQAECQQAE